MTYDIVSDTSLPHLITSVNSYLLLNPTFEVVGNPVFYEAVGKWLQMVGVSSAGVGATEGTLEELKDLINTEYGTWGYSSGISGTLVLTGGKKILQISAIAEELSATVKINGGDDILLPYGTSDKVSSTITIEPKGNLVNPTIVFTNTKSYFCEWVI